MHAPQAINQHNDRVNKKLKTCKFWFNGFCKFSDQQCRFLHRIPPRCKFQLECVAWPNCRFTHEEEYIRADCRYQENCRNYDCQFVHYNSTNEHFLGAGQAFPEMNMQNFPPLMPNQIPSRTNQHWRPW